MDNSLEVDGLTVCYSGDAALWDASFSVARGSLMAVVGPIGAGKTTLIKAVQNLVPRAAGEVLFFGGRYEAARRSVAYVPQRGNVDWNFPASVKDVVQMGTYPSLGWIRRPGKKERRRTFEALEKTGLARLAGRQIGELSGGQRQRVFIARALAQDASLYLMDEPFQGVDKTTETAVARLMREMRDGGKTVVAVHHDLGTVPDYFDSVTLLNRNVIASGGVSGVFTDENIRRAYSPASATEGKRGGVKSNP